MGYQKDQLLLAGKPDRQDKEVGDLGIMEDTFL